MSVLVTGGAGYIGSHMVHALVDAGETVVVLDNLSTGFWWALPGAATLVVGDMGDEALVGRVLREHGVEAIVHFAAKIVVPDSVADPLGYYLNNTVKSRALIAAAVAGGVKNIIFSSTAAVYGEVDTKPVAEDAPTEPVSPYGRSKLMTEWMLQDTARAHPISYVALRYFNVAGADPKGRTGQSTPRPRISSRSRARQRSAIVRSWKCSAPIIRRPTVRACATISRSATWPTRIWRPCVTCAPAAKARSSIADTGAARRSWR